MSGPAAEPGVGAARVLVTGGTGFIGSHLVRRLVRGGAEVHVLARPGGSTERLADVLPAVAVWPGEVTDEAAVGRCLAGARPELIFHLAGATDGRGVGAGPAGLDRSLDTNVRGTLNVARAAGPDLRGFIRAGGLSEYGNGPTPYQEDQREAPGSAYAAGQVAATHLCQMLHRTAGLPAVTLRPALTYGPGQSDDFLIPALIRAGLAGRPFDMTAGEQGRDLVYVEDVVEAFVRAAVTPAARGQVVNVGSGLEYRVRDVAELVVRLTGGRTALRLGAVPARPADVEHLVCDRSEAERLLGWVPRVSLEVGIARTIAWHLAVPVGG